MLRGSFLSHITLNDSMGSMTTESCQVDPSGAPREEQNKWVYILLSIQRPFLHHPWGVTLQMLNEKYLWVKDSGPVDVRGFWSALVPSLDPFRQPIDPLSFPRYLSHQALCPTDRQLLRGDYILAMNGRLVHPGDLSISTIPWKTCLTMHLILARRCGPQKATIHAPPKMPTIPKPKPVVYTNPLFRDERGRPLPYEDQDVVAGERELGPSELEAFRESSTVPVDFWSTQGYASFSEWMAASTTQWKARYSWNRRKREQLARECSQEVHVENFEEWLQVRKNQWRIQRRKRQRLRQVQPTPDDKVSAVADVPSPTSVVNLFPKQSELIVIDSFLEEQEREEAQRKRQKRESLDLSFLFDVTLGCPDDIVAHILRYVKPKEHARLLAVSKKTRQQLRNRDEVWRQLCPLHWTLPRRPRKLWCDIYLTKLQAEREDSQKVWDTILSRAADILEKGDQLQSIEKLVTEGERDAQFDVDYCSGVVCERNSILNLAAMDGRHKVVKWLVDEKHADIETFDRGGFTPLLNAAWAGDKYLVRFLMQRGANRGQVGTGHYTRPLAPPDFAGLTADGWAEKRGHPDIANLIRTGL